MSWRAGGCRPLRSTTSPKKRDAGLIAFHFKTKEGLILAVLDLLASNYEKKWLGAAASASASPAEKLRLLAEADFDARVAKTKHLAVWMAFWAETPPRTGVQETLQRAEAPIAGQGGDAGPGTCG